MPLDPYSTLGRSCEPAYQVNLPAEACVAISRSGWRLARAWRPRGELLTHLAGKLRAVHSSRSRNPARRSTSVPDDDPWLSPGAP